MGFQAQFPVPGRAKPGRNSSIVPAKQHNLPVWGAPQLRAATAAAGIALWSWNVDTDAITMDQQGFELWGLTHRRGVTFEDLSGQIHPADRDRVRVAFAATRAIVGPYEIDFRIMVGAESRWVAARGQGDDAAIADRIMFGIFLDVTQRKQAEEAQALLAGEMSHRVKNLLTIATALTTITSRSAETTADMARDLTRRLTALGRAHDLVRLAQKPGRGKPARAALLGDLLTILLAPYDSMGAFRGRIRVSVPKIGIGEGAATALALVLHELATNSLKYGALSAPHGTLDVACATQVGDFVVVWTERGGPRVAAPTAPPGFGGTLLSRSMSGQLGGAIDFNWSTEGLIATLRIDRARLAA